MGYYSTMELCEPKNVKFNPKRLQKLKDYFNSELYDPQKKRERIPFDISHLEENDLTPMGFEDAEIRDNGYVEPPEITAKFYDDRIFVSFYAWAMEEGECTFRFCGEDGLWWQYKCLPNKVIEYETEFVFNEIETIQIKPKEEEEQ